MMADWFSIVLIVVVLLIISWMFGSIISKKAEE